MNKYSLFIVTGLIVTCFSFFYEVFIEEYLTYAMLMNMSLSQTIQLIKPQWPEMFFKTACLSIFITYVYKKYYAMKIFLARGAPTSLIQRVIHGLYFGLMLGSLMLLLQFQRMDISNDQSIFDFAMNFLVMMKLFLCLMKGTGIGMLLGLFYYPDFSFQHIPAPAGHILRKPITSHEFEE